MQSVSRVWFPVAVDYRWSQPIIGLNNADGDIHAPFKLSLDNRAEVQADAAKRWLTLDALESEFQLDLPENNAPAFIFHMSRCGSTWMTRLLNEFEHIHCFNELPVINQILAPNPPNPAPKLQQRLLKATIGMILAQMASPISRLTFKLTSWNSLHANLLFKTFPKSPWIFLHRDPEEVLASLLLKPPGWFTSKGWAPPNKECDDFEQVQVWRQGLEILIPLLQERLEHMQKALATTGHSLDYRKIGPFIGGPMVNFINEPFVPENVEQMRATSLENAKAKRQQRNLFVDDSTKKRSFLKKLGSIKGFETLRTTYNKVTLVRPIL